MSYRNRSYMGQPDGYRAWTAAVESAADVGRGLSRRLGPQPAFRVTQGVYDQIRWSIGRRPAENGGMLGGDRREGVVRHFHFDQTGSRSAVTYSPDHEMLSRLLAEDWNPRDIQLMGFVHSHPGRSARPSAGDEYYATRILEANQQMDRLLMPIVIPAVHGGRFELAPFAAIRDGRGVAIVRLALEIISDGTTHGEQDHGLPSHEPQFHELPGHVRDGALSDPRERPLVVSPPQSLGSRPGPSLPHAKVRSEAADVAFEPGPESPPLPTRPPLPAQPPLPAWLDPQFPLRIAAASAAPTKATQRKLLKRYEHANHRRWTSTRGMFQRVVAAYDLPHLARCRVVYVGVGGAAAFAEELVRAGVGEHVLLDDDTVSESNLATQQTYRQDLGRPKVESLAERMLDINPNVIVEARQRRLDDQFSDDEFRALALEPLRQGVVYNAQARPRIDVEPLRPRVTLICGLTDQFEAQARVNRLALQLGLPSLCAQVYAAGRGAEVTFTHPDVTPACHRCVLGGRYRAYLDQGFQNNVTSDGTPIFSTSRLNALKGFVALALLHHDTGHPRWGTLLRRIGNRNLLQIRIDPDLKFAIFDRVFGAGDRQRIFADDVVWLPQDPESPRTGHPTCPECRATGNLRDAIGTIADTRRMLPAVPDPPGAEA